MLKIKNKDGVFKQPSAVFFRVRDTYKKVTNVYMNNAMIERAMYCQLGYEFNNLIQSLQTEIDFEVEYLTMITDPTEQLTIQSKITDLIREREIAYNEQIEISKKLTNLDIEITYKREVINMGVMLRSMVNIKNKDTTKNYNIIIVSKVIQHKSATNYHPDLELLGTSQDFKVNGKYYIMIDVNNTSSKVDEILSIYKTVNYEVVPFNMFMTDKKEEMGLSVKKVMISLDQLIYKQDKLIENIEVVKSIVSINPTLSEITEITRLAHNVTSTTMISATSTESLKFTSGVESKKSILSTIATNANITMDDPVSFVNELNVLITKVTEVENISVTTLPKKDYFTNYFSASDIFDIKSNKFSKVSNYPSWIIKLIIDNTFILPNIKNSIDSKVNRIISRKSDIVHNIEDKVNTVSYNKFLISNKESKVLLLPNSTSFSSTKKAMITNVVSSNVLEFDDIITVSFYHPIIAKNMDSVIVELPEQSNIVDRTSPYHRTARFVYAKDCDLIISGSLVVSTRDIVFFTSCEEVSMKSPNFTYSGNGRIVSMFDSINSNTDIHYLEVSGYTYTGIPRYLSLATVNKINELVLDPLIVADTMYDPTDPLIVNQLSDKIIELSDNIKITTLQSSQISIQNLVLVQEYIPNSRLSTYHIEPVVSQQLDPNAVVLIENISITQVYTNQVVTQYNNEIELSNSVIITGKNIQVVTQYNNIELSIDEFIFTKNNLPQGYRNINIVNSGLVYNKVDISDYSVVIFDYYDKNYYELYEDNGVLSTRLSSESSSRGLNIFIDTVTKKKYKFVFINGYLDLTEVL